MNRNSCTIEFCRARLVSFILFLAFLLGCGEDSPTGPENARLIPLIPRHTYVVSETGEFTLLDRDGSTFVIRAADGAPRIRVGYIIVGTGRGGFIRRVKRVSETQGALVLETEPASLTDAVIVGEIDTTVSLGAGSPRRCVEANGAHGWAGGGEWTPALHAPGVALSEDGLDLAGVILLDAGTGERRGTITITNGRISFNPLVTIGATLLAGSIDRLIASAEGTVRFSCEVAIDMPEPIDASGEIPLASFSASFVQYIGAVPIVETVTLSFSACYEVSGAYAGDCDVHFETAAYTGLSSSYRNGGWIDDGVLEDLSLDAPPLTCRAYADTDIRIYMIPRIDVSLYAEPVIELRAVSELHVHAETPAVPVWEWMIAGGFNTGSSIHNTILDEKLPPHAATLDSVYTRIGSGPFSTDEFVFVTSWGHMGDGDGQFLVPRAIAVDAVRNIYVVDSHTHRVQVFRPDSTFVTAWGGYGTGDGMFNFPHGIAVDPAGEVYVVDADNHRIQKFRPDGTFLTAWGGEGTGDGQFKDPQGIAAGSDGYIYVTDCFTHRIQRFTTEGIFVSAWGSYGTANGEFACPVGIAVSGSGTVYVSECSNHRIQSFTADGEFDRMWGNLGEGDGEFNCPIDVATDDGGTVYVVDYGNDRIQVFAPDGRFLTTLGTTGSGNGQFIRPEGLAVDELGQLYIVDSDNERVQRFAPKNR